ncbi:hypothetical protein MSVAZ_1902 [Methanosarcina vacuolata Z-761]|uniref:Uncharacterized protein n=1 Tax=Methanosarcina vacuolata Z-761 TaxID=1434123 RepID=A0A0E3LHF3_9EURY|nr:hypothetical protein MSVAZ_1902 [Methanosarcina vacuolata Z-761]
MAPNRRKRSTSSSTGKALKKNRSSAKGYGEIILSPIIPENIKITQKALAKSMGSLKSRTPRIVVPIIPIPVQTA